MFNYVPSTDSQYPQVLLFPALGYSDASRRAWRIDVHGAVYEKDEVALRRKLLLRLLRRLTNLPADVLTTEVSRSRIGPFVSRTLRDRKVSVSVLNSQSPVTCATTGSGHFRGTLTISFDEVRALQQPGVNQTFRLPIEARLLDPTNPTNPTTADAHLIETSGVSVISDIDDTIKHTNVVDRVALLSNTFLREFRVIDGMSRLYQTWARHGAEFHYVSASPWQLYEPLAELLRQNDFPAGTFHLKPFRLRQAMLRRMLVFRRPSKYARLRALVTKFPLRRFVLIGDSGEQDPEIYGDLARRFPRQISSILIHELPNACFSSNRQLRAFRDVRPDICRTFHNASELPESLQFVPELSP